MMRNIKTRFGFLITACLLVLPLAYNPSHACTSPAGVEGEIIFGNDDNTPAYCNNTDWIAMKGSDVTGSYIPNAVNFDGTNDNLNGTDVLSPDSSSGTLSVWFKLDNNSGGDLSIFRNVSGEFSLAFNDGGDEMRIYGNNPSGSNILDIRTANYNGAAGWHHLLASWDLSSGSPVTHVYLNDVSDQNVVRATGSETINYQNGSIYVGSNTTGGLRWEGDIADLWVETGTYIDLSVEANRRLFIDASGNPVNLGTGGSGPTGSAPDLFLSGDTDSWHTNKGTGGGFTENGALTTAATSPNGGTQIVPSGLIGHWRLDETSGTTAVNSASPGTHDGTYNAIDPSTDSVSGRVGNAIPFIAANDEYVQVTNDAAFDLTSYTLSAWVKGDNPSDESGSPTVEKIISKDFNFIMNWDHFSAGGASCEHWRGSAWENTGDAPDLAANTWYHLACTYDSVSQDYIFYVNGVETNRNTSVSGPQTDSQGVLIGRWQPGDGTQNINGDIDDVRIYNRALEADEIMAVYQAKDGIRYNENQKTMEFFDGNQFVSMTSAWAEPNPAGDGGPSYQANGVNFDGSTHLTDTTISGGDPTLITGSFWVRRDTGNLGVSQTILVYREASGGYFRIRFNSSNEFNIDGQQAGGGTFNILSGSSTTITDGNWHHIAFSIDSSNRSLDQIYIDDVDVTDARTATYTAFGGGEEYFLASFTSGGSAEVYGDLADFWIDFDTKLDLSVEANRRLFRDSDGNAVDLGSDGSTPTGSQPELFFSGDASSWHTNKGSLGGATETGTITEASADPGVPPSNGLIGHWKLDETSGTTAFDSSGSTNDGVITDGLDASNNSQPGAVGKSLGFLNNGDHVDIGDINDYDIEASDNFTLSLWQKSTSADNSTLLQKKDSGSTSVPGYGLRYRSSGTKLHWILGDGTNQVETLTDISNVNDGAWHHVVVVVDRTANRQYLYVDSVLEDDDGISTVGDASNSQDLRLGYESGGSSFLGQLDDVRIYDRALNTNEITQLYNMGTPAGTSTALPLDCPNIGDICDDGTVYAGLSQDGNIEMFAAPEDAPGVYDWKGNTGTGAPVTGATDENTGEANTNLIVTFDSDTGTAGFQIHEAALYCYNLVSNGADDWYLPARFEMLRLRNSGSPIGGLPSDNTRYWSSTEVTDSSARAYSFDGTSYSTGKANAYRVRCVRKGPAPRCANPYGLGGQMVYNTTEDVVQYCDGARWVGIGEYATPPADTTNPTWVTASGTVATINTSSALSATVTATDANGVTYSKVSGDAWISVNSSTGELTGTAPGTAGTYSITVRASDPSSNTADRSFDVVVTAASPPSIALTGSGNINSGATSHTHSSVNFGAAATDRIIAVATSYRRTGANTTTPITSMTIGGVSATQAIYTAASQRLQSTIWYANVPTGTSGDVVINAAENISSSISVYRMVDLTSSTPTATNGTGATGTTTTLGTTLTIQDDGVGICTAGNANDTATINWSGTQISGDTNIQNSSSRDNHHSAANITNTSGSSASRTYTSSWSGAEWSAQSCVAWR